MLHYYSSCAILRQIHKVKWLSLLNEMLHYYNSCTILNPMRYHSASEFNTVQIFCTRFCNLKEMVKYNVVHVKAIEA